MRLVSWNLLEGQYCIRVYFVVAICNLVLECNISGSTPLAFVQTIISLGDNCIQRHTGTDIVAPSARWRNTVLKLCRRQTKMVLSALSIYSSPETRSGQRFTLVVHTLATFTKHHFCNTNHIVLYIPRKYSLHQYIYLLVVSWL